MPCDANSLLQQVADEGLCGLSGRTLDLALVAALLPGASYPTASEVMAEAACYYGYSNRQLDEMIVSELCQLFG